MMMPAATIVSRSIVAAVAQATTAPRRHPNKLLVFLFHFGLFGLFLVSIVDSSFVPLPIPGITDIMIIVLAAQHANVFLLVLLATAGSAIGGYVSHQVGHSGGMAFIQKRIPPKIFNLIREWMENHAIPLP